MRFLIGLFTLITLFPFQSEAVIKSVNPQKSFLQEEFGVENIQDFLNLNLADIAKTTGKKLSLKDKVVLKLAQRKIKKKIKKGESFDVKTDYENASRNFNVGGFLLGFFIPVLGSLLAILFGGDAFRSSLLGLLCFIIVLIIIALAAGGDATA